MELSSLQARAAAEFASELFPAKAATIEQNCSLAHADQLVESHEISTPSEVLDAKFVIEFFPILNSRLAPANIRQRLTTDARELSLNELDSILPESESNNVQKIAQEMNVDMTKVFAEYTETEKDKIAMMLSEKAQEKLQKQLQQAKELTSAESTTKRTL